VPRSLLGLLALVSACVIAWVLLVGTKHPSNQRNWTDDGAQLPFARIAGNQVFVMNVRNFDYKTTEQWTPRWELRN